MSKEDIKILNYLIMCINEFAKQKSLKNQEAYNYLKEYKGLNFLKECYEAEHTVSLNDAIYDLTEVCKKNGGNLK